MSANLIANRYAKALLKVCEGTADLADKAEQFLGLCESMFDMAESKKILKSPVMPADLKKALLIFAAEKTSAAKEFANFAAQVVDAGRTNLIPEIADSFRNMLSEKRGLAHAVARSAEPMTDAAKSDLAAALEKVFNRKITLQNEVDKKVLGGFVVNVGHYTIDLSLKSRLDSVADFAQR
jgi:F-type H+-transporting ATPase subunit delta